MFLPDTAKGENIGQATKLCVVQPVGRLSYLCEEKGNRCRDCGELDCEWRQ